MRTSDIKIDGWDGVDMSDWPDMSDAYPTVAYYKSDNRYLDDAELEQLAVEHPGFCYAELLEWLS